MTHGTYIYISIYLGVCVYCVVSVVEVVNYIIVQLSSFVAAAIVEMLKNWFPPSCIH